MSDSVETRIPARMDRLPVERLALAGDPRPRDRLDPRRPRGHDRRRDRLAACREKDALGISEYQVAVGGTFYIVGAAIGALFFGYLTDRFGRKKLFLASLGALPRRHRRHRPLVERRLVLGVPLLHRLRASAASTRRSTPPIDELIPARARGWVDLSINGSYWLGAAFGAALSGVLLDTDIFAADVGWRLAFFLGAVLAVGIMLVRRHVPESPRWLMIHGRERGGRATRRGDRARGRPSAPARTLEEPDESIEIQQRESTGFMRDRAHAVPPLPAPLGARLHAAGHPGVRLQRRDLHVLDRADGRLQRRLERRRPLSDPVRDRQLPRRAGAGPPVRHRRAAGDDLRHLLRVGRAAGRAGRPAGRRRARRCGATWRSCARRSSSPAPPRRRAI